jgi:hypothetical protein
MARSRNKRGMGRLLKEMRTSPVAAVVNGVLGIGSILGTGILIVVRVVLYAQRSVPEPARQQVSLRSSLLFVCLIVLFLLGGIGFLLFALVQITTSIRVFGRGMVWCRFFSKRVVLWEEVAHFGPFDTETESLSSWSLLLRSGERIILHAGLYNRRQFGETMQLIAEEIKETQKQFG